MKDLLQLTKLTTCIRGMDDAEPANALVPASCGNEIRASAPRGGARIRCEYPLRTTLLNIDEKTMNLDENEAFEFDDISRKMFSRVELQRFHKSEEKHCAPNHRSGSISWVYHVVYTTLRLCLLLLALLRHAVTQPRAPWKTAGPSWTARCRARIKSLSFPSALAGVLPIASCRRRFDLGS